MRWLLVILAMVVLTSSSEARGRHRAQPQQVQSAYVQPVYSYYTPTISYYVAPVTYAFSPVYEVPVEVPAVVVPPAIAYEPPPSEVACEPPVVTVPPPAPVPAPVPVPMQPGSPIPAVPAVPGAAIPEPAPPSTPEMLPPTSPSSISRRVSAFRAASSPDRTSYSIYNSRTSGQPASADRASVTIWNLTGRTLVLSVNGRTLSISQGRKLEVETSRTFSWQVTGQSAEVTSVPEAQNGLTLAIRN